MNANLHVAIEKYADREVSSLSSEECRELITAYGDCTNELNAGHDPDDAGVWQAVLKDNMGAESTYI